VSAFSFFQFTRLTTDTGTWDLVWPQIWQGVGFGLIFVALSTAALSTVERSKMTAASGLYNVVRQIFGSVGIALAATQISSATTRYHAILAEHVTPYAEATRRWIKAAGGTIRGVVPDPGQPTLRALGLLDAAVMRQATVLAYNHAFLLISVSFLAAVPLALFLKGGYVGPVEVAAD
jgi:DHA2 family multidrug resistance protein